MSDAGLPSALPPYLCALWNIAPRIAPLEPSPGEVDVPPRPILSGGAKRVLHLPLHSPFAQQEAWRQAAASHAAAHWQFGGPPVPRGTLKLVQQALLGVLEDARVEWLAVQELPGLRALWLPFHEGPGAAQGNGFDALLGRLARSLLDPTFSDPHPWVAKARRVFFRADGSSPALVTPEAVRKAASLLGADIGQMRLPFNARTYRVHATYRDDNSQLWLQDTDLPPSDTPLEGGEGASAEPDEAAAAPMVTQASPTPSSDAPTTMPAPGPVAVYREWDHVIGRYRPAWCQVFSPNLLNDGISMHPTSPQRRLVHALASLQGAAVRTGSRAREGDDLHFGALVEAHIAGRLRQPLDPRIYRAAVRPAPPLAVLLLLDASASTARQTDGARTSLLEEILDAALSASTALQTLDHRSALWAFSSDGRHRVDMPRLKSWEESVQAPVVARRMAALRSAGSTRLGTALRHAMAVCAEDALHHPGWQRVIVLVTDGELHDIDVPNPRYLSADFRRAAMEANQRGLVVRALTLPPGDPKALSEILGVGSCASIRHAAELPRKLAGLLANLR